MYIYWSEMNPCFTCTCYAYAPGSFCASACVATCVFNSTALCHLSHLPHGIFWLIPIKDLDLSCIIAD